jgi:DNA topoisomerase-2
MSKKIQVTKKVIESSVNVIPESNIVSNIVSESNTDKSESATITENSSDNNSSIDEQSHLPSVGDLYKGKDQRTHIYDLPDTYIGSMVPEERKLWVYNETDKKMVNEKVNFISGLYKIYDEILVNALDQDTRILENIKYLQLMKDGLAPPKTSIPNTQMTFRIMKNLKVDINADTNTISVMNDGDGIDVALYPGEGIYVPEYILSNLLTSGNYDEKTDDPDKKAGKIVGGRNGYGAKLTNIFSTSFTVETVDANRKLKYTQVFTSNMTDKGTPVIQKYNGYPYTKITFVPDLARFKIAKLDEDTIKIMKRRVYDAGACVSSNISIYLNGEKINNKFKNK